MSPGRCPLKCNCNRTLSRRQFIRSSVSAVAGSVLLQGCNTLTNAPMVTRNPIRACGPASRYVPTINAAFVRRKEEYGMLWPGAVYDGEAARKMYTDRMADTADDSIIGAHCSCPTRLNGFDRGPEPFDLLHHHGNRDAVPRTLWRKCQRVTSIDLLPGKADGTTPSNMLISAGTVVDNLDVPPSGGCVVSAKVKFDGNQEVLSFPGFHQIFFYGDYAHQLKDFCQLCKFDAQIV